MITLPRIVNNVSDAELDSIKGLFQVLINKRPRNLIRSAYYDGTAPLKDLGISIPPQLKNVEEVIEWPEAAVARLAERNIFDGFVTPGQDQDPFDLQPLLDANQFELELPQAIVSAYKHSCSFILTTVGDVQSGEPEVLIQARSAEWTAATWDTNRRRISGLLAVTSTDDKGDATAAIVMLPDVVLTLSKSAGAWSTVRQPSRLGVVLASPLTYDPQLDRPFGRSRITRAVMSITDAAARTLLRTEVSAEFYASPQRYILGADLEAWANVDTWKATLGRWLALTKDEDGDTPSMGQFSQMTMQPHLDMFRQLAARFAGATGIDLNSLGVVSDNPSSAEAIYAAKEPLIVKALAQNRIFGSALAKTVQRAVMLRDGLTSVSDELRSVQTNWANPAFPSPVSAAQSLVQLATVFPWLGQSEVALEQAGFTNAQITRLLSDKRRSESGSSFDQLAALGAAGGQQG